MAAKTFVMLGFSDAAMLLGIVLLTSLEVPMGTMSALKGNPVVLGSGGAVGYVAYLLLLLGALTKAGAMPMHTWIPASATAASDRTRRGSVAVHPKSPPKRPMSDPWLSWVVAREPLGWNSTRTSLISPPKRSRAMRPIRTAAAQWELEGPRITGPMTSLKMLG